ncbi:MAG: 4-oxalocrotonate tautomerase [Rhodocyclaceae bacterium]|nr:4-oxalocrotonate tautomerase [Rhodocyclaceae bacterium]
MPFIRIAVAGRSLAAEQIAALQEQTTGLMVDVLGKRREVTVVAVDTFEARFWSSGGLPLGGDGRCAQMEAFITAGTNTLPEKQSFLAAAHRTLSAILGAADAPVYVVIHELPASDWGFDGVSQAARREAALAT